MKKYLADNVSGGEGCIFLTSVLMEVVKISDKIDPIRYELYGGVFDVRKKLWKEYEIVKSFRKETNKILNLVINRPGLRFFQKRTIKIKTAAHQLEKAAIKLIRKIPQLSDQDLKKAYFSFIQDYCQAYGLGPITFVYESFLNDILAESLAKRYYRIMDTIIHSFTEVKYKSFMVKSEELLAQIKRAESQKKRQALIQKFKRQFFFIMTNYSQSRLVDNQAIRELLKGINIHIKVNNRKKTLPPFKLNKKEKAIRDLLKPTTIIRDVRKKINLIGSYTMFRFLEEVAKRSGFDPMVLKKAFWFELFDVLSDKNLATKLQKRKVATCLYVNGQIIYSDKIIIREPVVKKASHILKGTVASAGYAQGLVQIVHGPQDFARFKKDSILAAFTTRPDFVPVMRKAAAILTQEGGLTCHAAIISRELGKPCVVGIKGLMHYINNGDRVEVDANKGIVKKITGQYLKVKYA